MISVIDCQMGNIGSVVNIIKHIGHDVKIITSAEEVLAAEKLIFPGVGHWNNGVANLNTSGLKPALYEAVLEKKTPILGICLGMQLLFKESEEGDQEALDLIPGSITRFRFDESHQDPINPERKLRIPHMGWNVVNPVHQHPIFSDWADESRFYFVHSYHANHVPPENQLMTCHYGYEFVCAVHKENIWGVQFHPEKSHKFGMRLLKNFIEKI
ncbi:imidazole glycerol phosphate synthase subunit HisH [Shewanella algae]|uniref:imidazole glycerol phosphate synthase subunit HisH n=1 Tax=Shewanella algae TaxID=38313 RepID=UPI0030042C71